LNAGGGTINAFNAGITLAAVISGPGALTTKSASGKIVTLTGANTYQGGTTVSTGQLTVSGATATLGTGNASVLGTTAGTFLSIASGVTNAIADAATLTLAGGGTAGTPDAGYIDLGAGVNETVASLVLVGLGAQAPGTYGGTGSSAAHILPEYFAADTGIITVPSAGLLGDFNSDGKVDAADYATWRKNDVANLPLANDNGVGNQAARFTLWRANFGNGGPGSGSGLGGGAVPEPSSVALLMLGLASLARRRRQR
jgi:hypothetical protein